MKKKLLMSAAVFCMGLAVTHAQDIGPSVLNSTGGSAALSGNTYEWSVGEMTLVSTFESGSLVVTQGVLQPSAISTGIQESLLPPTALQVYPNPASDAVYLKPELKTGDKMTWYLTDISGKIVINQGVTLQTGSDVQTLQFTTLAAGNYVLHVAVTSGNSQFVNNYKIQKIK